VSLSPSVLSVPYVYQLQRTWGLPSSVLDYACGPACAAMLAGYARGRWPEFVRAVQLVGGQAIVGRGTAPWAVAQAVRTLAPGVRADTAAAPNTLVARGLLSLELDRRRPLIALVRPSWVQTGIDHYVVVTGLDLRQEQVRLNDPLAGQDVAVSLATFLTAWQRSRWSRPFTYIWMG